MFIAETPQKAVATGSGPLNRLWSADPNEVRSFWRSVERYAPGANLGHGVKERVKHAIIVYGWCCDMCILPDGRRQIFSFYVPGDHLEIQPSSDLGVRGVVALTRLELVDPRRVPGGEAQETSDETELQAARQRSEERVFDHMVRLGQLTAKERVLHLFLELYERLDAVGLVKNDSYRLPLTQEIVADALGLSIVHINRTLQQLRREGLVTLKSGMVTLSQPSRLATVAFYRGIGRSWRSSAPRAATPIAAAASARHSGGRGGHAVAAAL
jgi:biotin operon repressor